jgi:hypothetical protein
VTSNFFHFVGAGILLGYPGAFPHHIDEAKHTEERERIENGLHNKVYSLIELNFRFLKSAAKIGEGVKLAIEEIGQWSWKPGFVKVAPETRSAKNRGTYKGKDGF